MSIYNITFSPTGGTQRVSDCLCSAAGEEFIQIDLTDRAFDPSAIALSENDLCVVSVPSFAGRVPETAAQRISLLKGNGAKAALVAVYGNRAYEDTLIELKTLLSESGFRCIAAVAAIAEHSMLRQYAAGRPDAQDMAELQQFGRKIAEIAASDSIPADLYVPGNIPYRAIGAFLKPIVADSCLSCGVCSDMCPVGAIPQDRPGETMLDQCISCMRCISVCPSGARMLDPATIEAVNGRLGPLLSGYKKNELFI